MSSNRTCMNFPIISHSTGKCSKTHHMRRTWKIGTHFFPIVCAFFPLDSHPMVYFIIWEMHGFPPSVSHSIGKGNKTHHMG